MLFKKKKPSNLIELKPNRCLYNSIIYETIIPKEKSFRSAELFFFLYCKLRFHDKEKEYKDNEELRNAFTENLKHLDVNAKNNCKTKCK